MRKTVLATMLTLGLATVAQAETTVLKYASFLPATTSNNSVTLPKVKEKLEALSNGTLSMEFYPGGTLGAGAKTQMRLVMNGVADAAEVVAAYNPGRVNGIEVFDLPGLSENNSDASLKTLVLIDDRDITGLERFVVLGVLQAGPYLIHSKTPVNSLEDLQDKRIRVTGAAQSSVVEAFGAVPVANIPATQIAENLSRNLLDGALVDMGNVYNFGIQDETKYHVTNLPLGSLSVLFLMNKKRYDSLDEQQKSAIDAVKGEWFTQAVGADMDAQTDAVLTRLHNDGGHYFVELPEAELARAQEKIDGVITQWKAQSDRQAALYDKAKAIE